MQEAFNHGGEEKREGKKVFSTSFVVLFLRKIKIFLFFKLTCH